MKRDPEITDQLLCDVLRGLIASPPQRLNESAIKGLLSESSDSHISHVLQRLRTIPVVSDGLVLRDGMISQQIAPILKRRLFQKMLHSKMSALSDLRVTPIPKTVPLDSMTDYLRWARKKNKK